MIDDLSSCVLDVPWRGGGVLIITVVIFFSLDMKLEAAIKWWAVRMRFWRLWVVWKNTAPEGFTWKVYQVFHSSSLISGCCNVWGWGVVSQSYLPLFQVINAWLSNASPVDPSAKLRLPKILLIAFEAKDLKFWLVSMAPLDTGRCCYYRICKQSNIVKRIM